MTAQEVEEVLKAEGNRVVVDIREGWERGRQWIAGSLHVPMGDLGRESEEWAPGHSVILVCKSGARSRRAASMLRQKGLTQVADLEGGMDAWCRAGLAVMAGGLASHWWPSAILLSAIAGAGLLLTLLPGTGPSPDASEAGCRSGGG